MAKKSAQEIVYFHRPGPKNTPALVVAVRARVEALGLRHVVVASSTGQTALAFCDGLKGLPATVIAVTAHAGWDGGDRLLITEAARQQLESCGAKVLVCTYALSGVARSISNKFGGVSQVEIIAHTLRLFGEGTKVAVEVAVMAADAGLVPTDCELIAVGGTETGADTALVLRPAHMNNFFDLEIREIIAKPRQRKAK
jgi:hypothetical protein